MIERLRKDDYEVRSVNIDLARRMVTQYHYAKGASNTATHLHGLFRRGDLFDEQCLGVAWWIPPTRAAAEATFPLAWQSVLCLSRMVILPGVPANACTFLLARSRRLIVQRSGVWRCLLTYADEWRGHTGAIYRADNWEYLGMTRPERTYQMHGRMVARKAGPRTHAEMLALGAVLVGSFSKHKFRRVLQ